MTFELPPTARSLATCLTGGEDAGLLTEERTKQLLTATDQDPELASDVIFFLREASAPYRQASHPPSSLPHGNHHHHHHHAGGGSHPPNSLAAARIPAAVAAVAARTELAHQVDEFLDRRRAAQRAPALHGGKARVGRFWETVVVDEDVSDRGGSRSPSPARSLAGSRPRPGETTKERPAESQVGPDARDDATASPGHSRSTCAGRRMRPQGLENPPTLQTQHRVSRLIDLVADGVRGNASRVQVWRVLAADRTQSDVERIAESMTDAELIRLVTDAYESLVER